MDETGELRRTLVPRAPPDRVRAFVAIARHLRAALAATGETTAEADAAIALIDRWLAGDEVSGQACSDVVYTEMGRGLLDRLMRADDPAISDLWNALTTATMCFAAIVYTRNGERMPCDVSEVGDDTFDLLEQQWRATGTYDRALFV